MVEVRRRSPLSQRDGGFAIEAGRVFNFCSGVGVSLLNWGRNLVICNAVQDHDCNEALSHSE